MPGVLVSLMLCANAGASPPAAPAATANGCLPSGDGYLRAHIAGAIETDIDWPNSGTHCEGEPRDQPLGVRMSFRRLAGASPDLVFVFGLTGVRQGKSAHAAGVNLTVIVQNTSRIYSTMSDKRCTIDSLTQRPLTDKRAYRVEARGFCTQPAHAVRGQGDLLVSTFDFAGIVTYDAEAASLDPRSKNYDKKPLQFLNFLDPVGRLAVLRMPAVEGLLLVL